MSSRTTQLLQRTVKLRFPAAEQQIRCAAKEQRQCLSAFCHSFSWCYMS